jgi:HlyD family secretion protein
MQVVASLDESDIGRIRPEQVVHFRVDAYATEDFTGTVTQVRLQPQVQQNVVTYSTVIAVPNPDLKLKPGMTANVTIEISRRSNVIRVPTAALRFRPTSEIYAALGQTPEPTAPARNESAVQNAVDAGRGSPGSGPRPELAALDTSARVQRQDPARLESLSARNPRATTVDALFGPLPEVESTGRVWLYANKRLRSIRVRLGIADGQASELLEGALEPGTELVTSITVGQSARPAATAIMPFMGGGPPPGGMPGGGGRGGGGAPVGR